MIIWIQELFMQLLIWLLGLVDGIFEVFSAAAGLTEVQIGGSNESTTLSSYFLSLSGVQKAFFVVLIASVGICAVCTVAAIIKSIVNAKGGEPKSHAKTLGQAMSTALVTLLMAIFMLTGVGVADGLLSAVHTGINGGTSPMMSHKIIELSVSETYVFDDDNILGLNEFDKDGNVIYVSYLYEYAESNDYDKKKKRKLPLKYNDGSEYKDCAILLKPKPDGADENAPRETYDNPRDIYKHKYNAEGEIIAGKFEVDASKVSPIVKNQGWLVDFDPAKEPIPLDKNILKETPTTLFGTYKTAVGFPTSWKRDGKIDPSSFNFVVAYICTIIVLIALVSATLGLVKRLFDLVLLFISLPGVVATIPLDDGAKFKLWRETVVSKVFLAFGSMFAVNVFFIVAPSLWSVSLPGEGFFNIVLRLVLICGGALTISGGQLLFARLLGTSAEESREMGQSARTLLGGAGVFGALAGGVVNTVGSVTGGQAYKNSKFGKGVAASKAMLSNFSNSSGRFGRDKQTGGNTLGSSIGKQLGKGIEALGGERGRLADTIRPLQSDKMAATAKAMQAAKKQDKDVAKSDAPTAVGTPLWKK